MKMCVKNLQQSLLTNLSKTITIEEQKEVLHREVEELCNDNDNQNDSILP
jgi:hypothetical protein